MGVTLDLEPRKPPLVLWASLSLVGKSHTLRCDAKQAEPQFKAFDDYLASVEHFFLGDCLPQPLVKGRQPRYLESPDPDGVPVVSTLAVQNLRVHPEQCRFISPEDFDALPDEKKPKPNDVLVTVDGGGSVGKPALFDLDDDFAVDSHVAILRPVGIDPQVLVYLLASPLGQVQFQRAESGASGQTGVSEEDIRRFRFPVVPPGEIRKLAAALAARLGEIGREAAALRRREADAWAAFHGSIVDRSRERRRIY
jgi:hypothetical protein